MLFALRNFSYSRCSFLTFLKNSCRCRFHIFSLLLFSLSLFDTDLTVSGLGMVHVTIPNAIQSGRNAILTCEYELESDDLYSVKWYKGKLVLFFFLLFSWRWKEVAYFYDVKITFFHFPPSLSPPLLTYYYVGKREFFRYTPKEIPSIKIFKLPGVPLRVDVS